MGSNLTLVREVKKLLTSCKEAEHTGMRGWIVEASSAAMLRPGAADESK